MIHAKSYFFFLLLLIDPSQEADILLQAVQAETLPHREEAIYSLQVPAHQALEVEHHQQAGTLHRRGSQEEAGSLRAGLLVVGRVDCPVKVACLLAMKGADRRG